MAMIQPQILKTRPALLLLVAFLVFMTPIPAESGTAETAPRSVNVRVNLARDVSIVGPLLMVVYVENVSSYETYVPRGIDFLEDSAPFAVRLIPIDGGPEIAVGKGVRGGSYRWEVDGTHGAVTPGVELLAPGESRRLLVDISCLDGAEDLVAGKYLVELKVFSQGGKIVGESNQAFVHIRDFDEATTGNLPDWIENVGTNTDHVKFNLPLFLNSERSAVLQETQLDSFSSQFAFHRAWRALLNASEGTSIEFDHCVQDAQASSIASMEVSVLVYEDAVRRGDQMTATRIRRVVESSMPEIVWRLDRADNGIGFLRLGRLIKNSQ